MDSHPRTHSIRRFGTPIQIRLRGRIVATTLPEMAGLRLMVEDYAGSSFNLDLEQVDFIDATGIDFLLALRALVHDHGGNMHLAPISQRVLHAMERSGAVRTLLSPAPAARLLVA